MPDDRGRRDQTRIDLGDDHQVRYWCEKIGCTRDELVHAVAQKGVMSEDVANYLRRTKR